MDPDEIRRIARLARLEISPEEAPELGRQLGEIVGYFEKLQACELVEADREELALGLVQLEPVEEADQIRQGLDTTAWERNAPASRDGFVTVPKIKAAHGEIPDGGSGSQPES